MRNGICGKRRGDADRDWNNKFGGAFGVAMTNTSLVVEPTPEELAIFDEISQIGATLWKKSKQTSGLSTDPKMYSIMLFK